VSDSEDSTYVTLATISWTSGSAPTIETQVASLSSGDGINAETLQGKQPAELGTIAMTADVDVNSGEAIRVVGDGIGQPIYDGTRNAVTRYKYGLPWSINKELVSEDFTGFLSSGSQFTGNMYTLDGAELLDGRVVFAYRDNDNNDYGTYVIFDRDGNEVLSPTVFYSNTVNYVSVTRTEDDNIFIVFRDDSASNEGYYIIMDTDGDEVKSPTQFISTLGYSDVEAYKDGSGRIIVVYTDTSNDYGTFRIYDSSGNEVVSPAVFVSQDVNWALDNGNMVIYYVTYNGSNYVGEFQIYDSSGSQIVGQTQCESVPADQNYRAIGLLGDGNFCIYYHNDNSTFGMYIRVYDEDGNIVLDATRVDSNQEECSVTGIGDKYILLLLGGSVSENYIAVYDQSGNEVAQKTLDESNNISELAIATFSCGRVAIVWESNNTSKIGYFTIKDYEQIIGLAQNTVSQGETVNVGITESYEQSGLEYNRVYYMQSDGSLGTTPTGFRVGRAISGDTIKIDIE
jgi:uncharacterized protein YrzB (UPF0473 family)